MKRLTLHLENEQVTRQTGADIAMVLEPGMLLFLKGDLGAGKTCLARAIIQNLAGDNELEVPSPTFSIVQSYEGSPVCGIASIIHADFYRLENAGEVHELGVTENDCCRLVLIEWPENANSLLGTPDLILSLEDDGKGRLLTIDGQTKLLDAIKRSFLIRYFLDSCWDKNVERQKYFGDASARSYESVAISGESRLLMNAPRQADGAVLRSGKSYGQLAHLAEDVSAFVGVQTILQKADFSVPKIFASNLKEGLLLLENLGNETIIDTNSAPIGDRYMICVETLAKAHQQRFSCSARLADGSTYNVPDYDVGAMLIEAELLLDWYAPRMKGALLDKKEREAFLALWEKLIRKLPVNEKVLVLRDFHSPNIIWLPGRRGIHQVGLIDFQDAVIGPAAYDMASLAQDARVDIPVELELRLVDHYIEIRQTAGNFDRESFLKSYAIMAAQRATKILGIFVRLDERDGKSAYLKHLPRMQDYISRSLKHPVLIDYRRWYENVMNIS